MKVNVSFLNFFSSVSSFFKRFHAIIFFLVVSACLFTAIFLLLPITNISSSKSTPTGQSVDTTLDQATIDKLRNGAGAASTYQPGARTSPFSE